MLDWWTVRGERFGIKNLDFRVEIWPDRETSLSDYDYDRYDDLEADAFGDAWWFVVVRVTPTDEGMNDLTHHTRTLPGVEWGQLGLTFIDRGEVTEASVTELVQEILNQMELSRRVIERIPGLAQAA